jgi:hypothetical protein
MPTPYEKFYQDIQTGVELEKSKEKGLKQEAIAKAKAEESAKMEQRNRLSKIPLFINGKKVNPTEANIFQDAIDEVNKLKISDESEYNKAFQNKARELFIKNYDSDYKSEYPVIKLDGGVGSLDQFRGKPSTTEESITNAFREGLAEAQVKYPDNPEKHDQVTLDFVKKNYPELPQFDAVPVSVKKQLSATASPSGILENIGEAITGSRYSERRKQAEARMARVLERDPALDARIAELTGKGKLQPQAIISQPSTDVESVVSKTSQDIAAAKQRQADVERRLAEINKSLSAGSLHPWEGSGFKKYTAPAPVINSDLTSTERRAELGGYKGSMIEGMPAAEYWKLHPKVATSASDVSSVEAQKAEALKARQDEYERRKRLAMGGQYGTMSNSSYL